MSNATGIFIQKFPSSRVATDALPGEYWFKNLLLPLGFEPGTVE